ncbi:MAG: hypothetical protein KY475_01485 [Planctomycetes bacterium]|nr:hypothetical protein [Planctomycetota bacterium]
MSSEAPLPAHQENPYQAWAFQEEAYPAEPKPLPGYRPGGLTAVCVIAVILGALGLLAAVSGITMALVGNQVQQFQQQFAAAGSPPEMRDLQTEFNNKTIKIANRFRLVNLSLSATHLIVAGCLVWGGVRALQLKDRGRRLLWTACIVAIVFELAQSIPYILMQMENTALMQDYMPRLMEASAPGPQSAQVAEFGRMIARFSMIMGWVIFIGWLTLKLAFYGIAAKYLSSSRVKSIYGAA